MSACASSLVAIAPFVLAFAVVTETRATDGDALDLFCELAPGLIARVERRGGAERLNTLADLDAAALRYGWGRRWPCCWIPASPTTRYGRRCSAGSSGRRWLSFLVREHIELHGRYSFSLPTLLAPANCVHSRIAPDELFVPFMREAEISRVGDVSLDRAPG